MGKDEKNNNENLNNLNEVEIIDSLIVFFIKEIETFITNFYLKNKNQGEKKHGDKFYIDSDNPYLNKLRKLAEYLTEIIFVEDYLEEYAKASEKNEKIKIWHFIQPKKAKNPEIKQMFDEINNFGAHANESEKSMTAEKLFSILKQFEKNINKNNNSYNFIEKQYKNNNLLIENFDKLKDLINNMVSLLEKGMNSQIQKDFNPDEDSSRIIYQWENKKEKKPNNFEIKPNNFKISSGEYSKQLIQEFLLTVLYGNNFSKFDIKFYLEEERKNKNFLTRKILLNIFNSNLIEKNKVLELINNLDNIFQNNQIRWNLKKNLENESLVNSEFIRIFFNWFREMKDCKLINFIDKDVGIWKFYSSINTIEQVIENHNNKKTSNNFNYIKEKIIFLNKEFQDTKDLNKVINFYKEIFFYKNDDIDEKFENYYKYFINKIEYYFNEQIFKIKLEGFSFGEFILLLSIKYLENFHNETISLQEVTDFIENHSFIYIKSFKKKTILYLYDTMKYYLEVFDNKGNPPYFYYPNENMTISKEYILNIFEIEKIAQWVWHNWFKKFYLFFKEEFNKEEDEYLRRIIFNDIWIIEYKIYFQLFLIPREFKSKKEWINGDFGIKNEFINIIRRISYDAHFFNINKEKMNNFIEKLSNLEFDLVNDGKEWFKCYEEELKIVKESINNKNITASINLDEWWKENIINRYKFKKEELFLKTFKDEEILKIFNDLPDEQKNN